MKNTQILWVYFSISVFSTPTFAQIIGQNYTAIFKTNVLIVRDAQQWSLSLESKTKRSKQTNNYTIGYNNLLSGESSRAGGYVSYARRFYTTPVFDYLYFFLSPYSKVIYRDVYEKSSWLIGGRSFQSISIVTGGSTGVQSILFKRLSIELVAGLGLGAVLWQQAYYATGKANPIHLDAQLMLQLGYKF